MRASTVTRQTRYASVAIFCAASVQAGTALAIENVVGVSNNQPVLLIAQAIGYDNKTSTAVAKGEVQIVQGDTTVLADRVTYDQKTDTIHASGHVSIMEPTGDVLFTDDAVLNQNMEKGVVQQFKARLKDNSLFAAKEADKVSKNVTKMHNVVYSPCNVCAENAAQSESPPLWQMEAQKVTIDENEQKVKYQNAFLDVLGFPVLYTPYFSHPTPDAPSESGLLQPQYYHSSLLGSVIKEPVYVSFAPNADMTLTPWYLSNEYGPMLQGEFRYLSENGSFLGHGAIIDAYNPDDYGMANRRTEVRDYIDAHGTYKFNQYWDAGLDLERTSDNTFLTYYSLGWQDMLTSRLYAERIEDRDYALIQSLAFQGLQPEDIANQSPYILPQASIHLESDAIPEAANSRFMVDASALELERQVGDSDQRASSAIAWKLPYITHNGQVLEFKASMRGDAYNVNDLSVPDGATFDGQTGRFVPEVDLNWRYPFIKRFGDGGSLMLSPILEMAASPNIHNNSNIPNEDSQNAELNNLNIFSADRFAGLDEVESGFRGSYGMRGELALADEKYFEWLLGQAYQADAQSPFPIAQAQNTNFSDYVGHVEFRYKSLDLGYSFRVDRDSFAPTSNEVNGAYDLSPLHINIIYTDIQNDPVFGDLKEITGNLGIDVTSNWTWKLSGSEDLGSNVTTTTTAIPNALLTPNLLNPSTGTVGFGSSLIYHNECMNIIASLTRSEITDQDVRPSTSFGVALVLKNFGAPNATPNPMNNVAGSQSIISVPTSSGIDALTSVTAKPAMSESQLFDNPTAPAAAPAPPVAPLTQAQPSSPTSLPN